VPAATEVDAVGGADPVAGLALSQLPPLVVLGVIDHPSVPPPLFETWTDCAGGSARPCSPEKLRLPGAIERVGGNTTDWIVTAFEVAGAELTPPPLALPLNVTEPATLAE
jgi:hypothetical protein